MAKEVLIDGEKYVPENKVYPTKKEIIEKIKEVKKLSRGKAMKAVPHRFIKDDDRGIPFDAAYDERMQYENGFEAALTEILYMLESE